MRATARGLAFGLTLLASARAARAGEPVRLHWVRGEGAGACIDPATLEARVRQRLGSDPFDVRAARTVEGIVRRAGDAWEADIAVRAHPSDLAPPLRQLRTQARHCDALSEAVVLAVALAIDPAAAFSTPAKPRPASAPAAAAPAPVATMSERPAAVTLPGRAQLTLAGQAGLLPRASLGAGLLAAAMVSPHFEIAVGAQVFPAVEVQGDPSFAIGLAFGDVRVCVRRSPLARVDLLACVGSSVGFANAAVLTGDRAQPGERPWLAAEAGLDAAVALTRSSAIRLGVEGVVPLTRYRFVIESSGATLFRQHAVAVVPYAGLELHFGGAR